MLPVLVKPKLLTIRNRWRRRRENRRLWMRNLILVLLTVFLMSAAFQATYWVLHQTRNALDFAYLHSSVLMGLVLVFLLLMLLVTNTAAALGTFFLADDLGLLISSPISTFRFFWGRYVDVVVSSSWMTAVFLIPIVFAFGAFFGADPSFYALAILVFVPYFMIPAGVAVIVAALVANFGPQQAKRELLIIFGGAVLAAVYMLGRTVGSELHDTTPLDVTDILRLVSFLALSNKTWSPSHWAAGVLGEGLEPGGIPAEGLLLLLYTATIAIVACAYLIFRFLFFRGFSRVTLSIRTRKIQSRISQRRIRILSGWMSNQARALAVKEYKSASRDVTQSVQALLLLGLCALYLYMLNFQHVFQYVIPSPQRKWWRFFLISTNLCIEAFVITAMGTRLVFPSVSREGRSFWVLQTAPISCKRLLTIKFWTWLTVVALLTSIIFGAAAYLLYGSFVAVAAKIVSNFIICVGLVGLGVGLGAYFAEFDWQHPSELTAGFGTLVYMLGGVLLIALNLMLSAIVLYVGYGLKGYSLSTAPGAFFAALGTVVLMIIGNSLVARWALSAGAAALAARE